jgi:hypothetical protein
MERLENSNFKCDAYGTGKVCVAGATVNNDLDECATLCQQKLDDNLVSASLDTALNRNCCCHDSASCECAGPGWTEFPKTYDNVMFDGASFPDLVCPPSPVNAGITKQCRPFPHFSPVILESCHVYLSNTSPYYLLDDFSLDRQGDGLIHELESALSSVLSSSCTSNLMSWICSSFFRECKEGTNTKDFFPSLMCRSECKRHRLIWDECLADLSKDATAIGTLNALLSVAPNLVSPPLDTL